MQEEREPVGEHFLGHGLGPAKREMLLNVRKSFLFCFIFVSVV